MKKIPIRLLSLIVALMLALSAAAALSSCANSGQGDDTTAPQAITNSDVTTAPEETELVSKTLPAGLDYGGETIVIMSRNADGVNDEFLSEEIVGDLIKDSVYKRNKVVEKQLNIVVDARLTASNGASLITDELVASLKSGDHLYDIISNSTYSTVNKTSEGILRNLRECDYIDLSAPYWSKGYSDAISVGQGQYLATGAISLSMYRYMFVTFFNSNMFEEKNQPLLYGVVDSGDWTLDYQIGLLDVFYDDLNGNGSADENDCYGFATNHKSYIDPYWSSCDLPILVKNSDNWFEMQFDTDRVSQAVDKILELYWGKTYIGEDEGSDPGYQARMTRIFSESRAATCTMRLLTVETEDIKNMNDVYGIIPMPKLNADQAEYHTFMHDQLSAVGIPFSVTDEARFLMIGAVLEAMAVESQKTLVPAYYEVALKGRYLRSSQAVQMLDLIYDSVKMDGGVLYTSALGSIHATLRTIIDSKTNTVASSFKSSVKVAEKNLGRLQDTFRDMQKG